jgi:hypothetical protein
MAIHLLLAEGVESTREGGEVISEPVFLNVYGAQESIPRNEFRQPIVPGRYNNPIPPRFLAPIDCLKIPAQNS